MHMRSEVWEAEDGLWGIGGGERIPLNRLRIIDLSGRESARKMCGRANFRRNVVALIN